MKILFERSLEINMEIIEKKRMISLCILYVFSPRGMQLKPKDE